MGCLNDNLDFDHWFGNIHLSGPCNRSCYFCIGQHMMEVDSIDARNTWPLPKLDEFFQRCHAHRVKAATVTGTNTDPSMYEHLIALRDAIDDEGLEAHLRTNGVKSIDFSCWDKVTVSVCSLDEEINQKIMGGPPPSLSIINQADQVAIVLCPESDFKDLMNTIRSINVFQIQIREPYGQPYQGDPLKKEFYPYLESMGNPTYKIGEKLVTYWDVHSTEVKSVNLFMNGVISESYSVTKGVVPGDKGQVLSQESFPGGRIQEQWLEIERGSNA